MKSQTTTLQQVVNTGLAIAFLSFIYLVVRATFQFFNSLNSQFAMSLVAASVTVIVSVISLLVGKFIEQKYKIQQEIREKKSLFMKKSSTSFLRSLKTLNQEKQ